MALVNHRLENFLRYGSEAREGKGQRNGSGRSTEKKKKEGKYLPSRRARDGGCFMRSSNDNIKYGVCLFIAPDSSLF